MESVSCKMKREIRIQKKKLEKLVSGMVAVKRERITTIDPSIQLVLKYCCKDILKGTRKDIVASW